MCTVSCWFAFKGHMKKPSSGEGCVSVCLDLDAGLGGLNR